MANSPNGIKMERKGKKVHISMGKKMVNGFGGLIMASREKRVNILMENSI
jgi:hypothetical protein